MKQASKNEIKILNKLKHRKHREKEGLFVAEGDRVLQQIMENGRVRVHKLFAGENWIRENENKYRLPISVLPASELSEASDTETPQGVMALCELPPPIAVEHLSVMEGVLAAFDAIQDPGNLGTMIRTAAWFGAKGILVGSGTVDMFNPKTVRSTAGAIGMVPYCTGEAEELLETLEQNGWNIVLLDAGENSIPLSDLKTASKTVLLVGNEGNGIRKELFKPGRVSVKIPSLSKRDAVESLNAAVAFGIGIHAIAKTCLAE